MKNYLSLAGAELLSKIVTFLAFAFMARMVGPSHLGYIELACAVYLCASLLLDQGLGPYGAREVAKAPSRTHSLVQEIVTARFALAGAAFVGVVAFALLHRHPPVVTLLLLIYGVCLLELPLLLVWVFQGHDRMGVVAAAQVIRQAVFALLIFSFVRDGDHIWLVAVADLAGLFCASLFTVYVYHRAYRPRLPFRPKLSRELFRESLPIGVSQMFWLVKVYGATILIGLVASSKEIGFFAGSMRILLALHTFVWLYYFNLLPSMSRAWRGRTDGGTHFVNLIDRSFRCVAWVAAPAGLMMFILSSKLIVVVYGEAFAEAGRIFQWLGLVCVFSALSGHYRFGLIAAGKQKVEMLTSVFGAISAALLVPLGYVWRGPEGSAFGLVLVEAIVFAAAWACARGLLGLRGHAQMLWRPLIVTAVSALLAFYLEADSPVAFKVLSVAALFGLAGYLSDPSLREILRQTAESMVVWVRAKQNRALPQEAP